jgi:hypothetical protein
MTLPWKYKFANTTPYRICHFDASARYLLQKADAGYPSTLKASLLLDSRNGIFFSKVKYMNVLISYL